MKNRFQQFLNTLRAQFKRSSRRVITFIDRHPFSSFIITLGLLLALIIISNLIPKPTPPVVTTNNVKTVEIYHIGRAPKVTVQAQIKKTGVIQIVAQTAGIVNYIHVSEGSKLSKGTPLVNIAANYYGGNSASLQRQIAQKQHESIQATYPTQKELIQKQKELANKTDENSDQMREISNKASEDTRGLIDLNDQMLKTLDESLATLQQNSETNKEDILRLQQQKAQLLASLNQARSSLRTAEFQSAGDKPPAQLTDLTRETATKQLEIQEKQLEINKEISQLQFALARVNEATFFPTSPFSGTVQRVLVKPFENVTPGTPLMIISQNVEEDPISAVAFVSQDIATRISEIEMSDLHIGNKVEAILPSFISNEAVEGNLYAIFYSIPDTYNKQLTDGGFIQVDIPVGYPDTSAASPFVPIDAVYQSANASYIYVVEDHKAKAKSVSLGQVFGNFVEIESGLTGVDQVILNRNVIEGDTIQAN